MTVFHAIMEKQPASICRTHSGLRVAALPRGHRRHTHRAGSGLNLPRRGSITAARKAALFPKSKAHDCFPQSNHAPCRPASFSPEHAQAGRSRLPDALLTLLRRVNRKEVPCFASSQGSLRNVEVMSEGCPEEQLPRTRWNSHLLARSTRI